MKNNTRKILVALLLVFVMMVGIFSVTSFADASGTTVYFENNWLWTDVCCYYWGDGIEAPQWPGVPMTNVGTQDGYELYSFNVPTGATGIIFNGIKDDGSGNRDQSPDIVSGIVNGAGWKMFWDNGNLVETFTYQGGGSVTPPDEPFVDTHFSYTVAGTPGLCGTEWDTNNTDNDLTLGADGVYSITFANVPAGEHKFKVAADHAWDNAWPGQDYAFTLTEACDVTIKFNPQTKKVEVIADKLDQSATPPVSDGLYTVAGQSALCGSEWSTTDTYNDMVLNAETGLYEKTFTGVAAGSYECKVVVGHSWDVSYGGDSGEFGNYSFTIEEELNVTITFDPVNCVVGHYTSESTGATERPEPEKPEINYDETIRIYLSDSANWETPFVYYWTLGSSDQNASWPGEEMEWDSEKLLFYVDVPTYYANIIFNNGNGIQTADLSIPDDGFIFDNLSQEWSDLKNYTPPVAPEDTTEEVTVYVKDSLRWGNVYIYFWNESGIEAATWPGVAMTLGEDGYYYYTIPAGYSNVIFNNGGPDGQNIQTENLNIPKDGKVYIDNSNEFLNNDSLADGDKAWYALSSGSDGDNNQGGNNQGGNNQGGNAQPEQPKAELTFLQKLAYSLLLWLRSMEEFFKNMFAGTKA